MATMDELTQAWHPPRPETAEGDRALLAQMAATIAAGIVCQTDAGTERWCVEEGDRTHGPIADAAVGIARRILEKVEER